MNRTIAPTLAALSVALNVSLFTSHSAFAQASKPESPAKNSKVAPPAADPNAIRKDIYDLALLHAIQGISLSQKQIDTVMPVLKEIFEADQARKQKDDDAVRELADDVKKARAEALEGTTIPKELEARVVEVKKGVAARALAAINEAVGKVLTVLWPTLTDSQKTEMEAQSREYYGGRRVPAAYQKNPAKAPKEEVQKLAAGAFVENVLLDERTPALLGLIKPAKNEETKEGNISPEPAAKP